MPLVEVSHSFYSLRVSVCLHLAKQIYLCWMSDILCHFQEDLMFSVLIE